MNTKHQYKFRAECIVDFSTLLTVTDCILSYRVESMDVEGMPVGDIEVEVTLQKDKTQDDLVGDMSQVVDSHVMRETLKPIDEYTGER